MLHQEIARLNPMGMVTAQSGRLCSFGASARDFGWGIAEAGHNFIFAEPEDWPLAVTGSLLAHLGKHGPLILLAQGRPSDDLARYLASVQPVEGSPDDQVVNHGWVLGDRARISWALQADLDLLLEPRHSGDSMPAFTPER